MIDSIGCLVYGFFFSAAIPVIVTMASVNVGFLGQIIAPFLLFFWMLLLSLPKKYMVMP